jgi:P27 family predicted phage terminase small subunit
MAGHGRPRLGDEHHRLYGSERDAARDRAVASRAPSQVVSGRPRCPQSVKADAVAFAAWKSAVRMLRARGVLTPGDAPTLELYAQVYSRWQTALADVKAHGFIVTVTIPVRGGTAEVEKPNPAVAVAQTCEARLLALAKSLGLTPEAREKIKRVKPNEKELSKIPETPTEKFRRKFVDAPKPILIPMRAPVAAEPSPEVTPDEEQTD